MLLSRIHYHSDPCLAGSAESIMGEAVEQLGSRQVPNRLTSRQRYWLLARSAGVSSYFTAVLIAKETKGVFIRITIQSLSRHFRTAVPNLWSVNHKWSSANHQVVHGWVNDLISGVTYCIKQLWIITLQYYIIQWGIGKLYVVAKVVINVKLSSFHTIYLRTTLDIFCPHSMCHIL